MDPYYPHTPQGYYPPPPQPQQPPQPPPRPVSAVYPTGPAYQYASPPANTYPDPNSYFPPSPGPQYTQAYAPPPSQPYTSPSASLPNVNQLTDQFGGWGPYGPQNPQYPPPSPSMNTAHLYPPQPPTTTNMPPPPKPKRPGSTPPVMGNPPRQRSGTYSSGNPARASGELHAPPMERRMSSRRRAESRPAPPQVPMAAPPMGRTTSSGGAPPKERQYSTSKQRPTNGAASTASSNTTTSSTSHVKAESPPLEEERVPEFIVNYWGPLLIPDKRRGGHQATEKLTALLIGVAKHLIECFEPKSEGGGAVVGPQKMLSFYSRFPVKNDDINWEEIFKRHPRDLARLYRNTHCAYHLFIPEDELNDDRYAAPKALPKPSIPGLTPSGFADWVTIHVLLRPRVEIFRLQRLLRDEPINSASLKDDRRAGDIYERFPKLVPSTAFLSKECDETRALFGTHFGLLHSPTSSTKQAQGLQRYQGNESEDYSANDDEEDDYSDDDDLPDRPGLRKQATIRPGQYSLGPGSIRNESVDRSTVGVSSANHSRRTSGIYSHSQAPTADSDSTHYRDRKSHRSHRRKDSGRSTAAVAGGSPALGAPSSGRDSSTAIDIPTARESRPYAQTSQSASSSAANSYNSSTGGYEPGYYHDAPSKSRKHKTAEFADPSFLDKNARLANEFDERDGRYDQQIDSRKEEAERLRRGSGIYDESFYGRPTGSHARRY